MSKQYEVVGDTVVVVENGNRQFLKQSADITEIGRAILVDFFGESKAASYLAEFCAGPLASKSNAYLSAFDESNLRSFENQLALRKSLLS